MKQGLYNLAPCPQDLSSFRVINNPYLLILQHVVLSERILNQFLWKIAIKFSVSDFNLWHPRLGYISNSRMILIPDFKHFSCKLIVLYVLWPNKQEQCFLLANPILLLSLNSYIWISEVHIIHQTTMVQNIFWPLLMIILEPLGHIQCNVKLWSYISFNSPSIWSTRNSIYPSNMLELKMSGFFKIWMQFFCCFHLKALFMKALVPKPPN